MKVKLAQIFESKDTIQKIIGMELPVKTAYKIAKVAKKVSDEFTIVEEQRAKLIRKYGEEKEGQFQVKKDRINDFMTEFNTLLNEETDIIADKIKLDDLSDIKLTTKDIISIEYLLEN